MFLSDADGFVIPSLGPLPAAMVSDFKTENKTETETEPPYYKMEPNEVKVLKKAYFVQEVRFSLPFPNFSHLHVF